MRPLTFYSINMADMADELFVADIFASVQGEGAKIGTPSIFVRLGICNLQCNWCDTTYTWKKGETDYVKRPVDWIVRKISELRKKGQINNLVITGGEPLLQQKMLVGLLADASLKDMNIEFETNGSMPLMPEFKKIVGERTPKQISFNVSPKLIDSGNKPYKVHDYPGAVLKFVYVNKKSEKLIDDFVRAQKNIQKTPVYIMPEGTSVEAMEKKYKDILAYCARRGFTFTPRLHIYLFGNKRAT